VAVRLDPSDEYMDELGPEPNFNESMYINCLDPEQQVYGLSEYLDQIVDGAPVDTAE
jgi:hypothetical protein